MMEPIQLWLTTDGEWRRYAPRNGRTGTLGVWLPSEDFDALRSPAMEIALTRGERNDARLCMEAYLAAYEQTEKRLVAATARAERLAALLGELEIHLPGTTLAARIDAELGRNVEIPAERIAALKDAIDANAEERNRFDAPTPDDRRGEDGGAIAAQGGTP